MRRLSFVLLFAVVVVVMPPPALAQCRFSVSPATPANATVGVPYSETFTGSDLLSTYTFKEATAMPPGLALAAAGTRSATLSGRPTTAGAFTFDIEVTETTALLLRCTQTFRFTLTVCDLTISPLVLPTATVGAPYAERFSGGTAYSLLGGRLPDGLTLKEDTIIGTPTAAGKFNFTIGATDGKGCTASRTYDVIVNCPPVAVNPLGIKPGRVGDPYSETFTAAGGTAPYRFVSTALPPGLTLTTDGSLSGVPTAAGASSFTITATDAYGCSGSRTYSLAVCPVVTVLPEALPAATVGKPYSGSFGASGGTGPYAFSVAAGSLPAGLTIETSTGKLSGTPTATGTARFTILARDANGCAGTASYAIEVACPTLAVTPAVLPSGNAGTFYSAPLTAANGTEPYAFALSGGTLPAGLSLSSDGKISGTPTTAGSASFVVTVTDANRCTSSSTHTITIDPPRCSLITLAPDALPGGKVDSAYRASVSATGGAAPYTYEVVAGSLPPGLRFSAGTVDGTPTLAGSYTFTIGARDANSCTGSRSYSVRIDPAEIVCKPIAVGPPALGPAKVGSDFKAAFTAAGGTAPYTYALGGGALPPGLILEGGLLAGTPAREGSYTFTIVAADAAKCTGSNTYTMIVEAAVQCPTAAPSLLAPAADAGVDGSKPITFNWTAVAAATGYDLLTSTDGGATFSVQATTSGASSTSATVMLPAGKYVWGVRANGSVGCRPALSEGRVLTVTAPVSCPTESATLLAPANGAENVGTLVVFEWQAVRGAVEYALLLSVDGGTPRRVATTTETALKLEVPAGTISWSVATSFPDCAATLSRVFTFKTGSSQVCPANPQAPSLIDPADGATNLASPVKLSWSAVAEATSYRLIAVVGGAVQTFETAGTSYELSVSTGTVTWQVESLFKGCPSSSRLSAKRTFTVASPTNCGANAAPVPLSPANGASSVVSPVTFTWTASPRAIGYRLFLATGTGTPQLAAETRETSHTQIISTPGRIAWQVYAIFLGCDPVPSPVSTFTLVEPKTCPQGTVTLKEPAAGARVSSPVTFSWDGIAGTRLYRVWVSAGDKTWIAATTTSTTAAAALPAGELQWRVEAQFDGECRSIFSSVRSLIVADADTCSSTQAPALVSPLGTADRPADVTGPVELKWSAAAGASEYHVFVSINGAADAAIGVTRETSFRFLPEPGSYSWFVQAVFPGCRPLPSARSFFRVPQTEPRCRNDAPSIIAPADGATVTTPEVTFLWSAVADAIEYRVHAWNGERFVQIGATKSTSLVRPAPPGSIVWYVEAVIPQCPSTESGRARFTVPQATVCPDERPEPISPRNGAESVESPVELSWSAVSGAIGYVVVAQTALGTPTVIGETRSETSLKAHMPAGQTIEWRVIVLRAGCQPLSSASSKFTVAAPDRCDVRPPVLQSPADGERVPSPVPLAWTPAPGATGYRVWASVDGARAVLVATPAEPRVEAALPAGSVEWFVEAVFANCPPLRSATRKFEVIRPSQTCQQPDQPVMAVIGQAISGTQYNVRWTPLGGVSTYELQESDLRGDFSAARTTLVQSATAHPFTYTTTVPVQKFYRVRGVSACNDERGPYSEIVGVHIVPVNTFEQKTPGTAEIGLQQSVVQTVFLPGQAAPISFTATTDRPWLRVSPSTGTLPAAGIELTVTADPAALALGANTGTLLITYGTTGSSRLTTHASTPVSVPVSISLVTPVSPASKNTPMLESLVIPAVGHALGANNSLFQSDVRIANTSTQPMTYLLNFTPSGVEGTLTGSSTTIQVDPGATAALNDILASFFGTGPGGTALGVLEIRPMASAATSSSALSTSLATATIASSRTYNVTANGTLGQYIPAIPFSKFISRPTDGSRAILTMQQIAESAAYRTNLGLVEGSGQPAEVMIRVFDTGGRLVAEIPESLRAGEHKQINSILGKFGIQLNDGRFEVEVTSATGKITAYASRVDNVTNDPLLVQPVVKSAVRSTRYVVPGIIYADGLAKWRSDLRVFNAAETAANATITFFPASNPAAPMSKEITIPPGEILALDNVLRNFFGINDASGSATGSILVTTPLASSIVATARTYADSDAGTYGLFAPGVTPEESVGRGERSLHLLQLEQSADYRTNIGLVETSGRPASVEISLIQPDVKATGKYIVDLPANGFIQFPMSAFQVNSAVYNARVAVRVTSGSGRVSAYGSVVDNRTNDSTYVPAQ